MVKHIILWQLKDNLSDAEKTDILNGIKTALEGLNGKIPGLLSLKIITDKLPSSNADVMLYSEFENEDSLKGYSVHPLHVAAADNKVRPFTKSRTCIDYEI